MVEICRRTVARTGGVVHMPSYIGVGPFSQPVGYLKHGGLDISDRPVRGYLMKLFEQLEKMESELIVLLRG